METMLTLMYEMTGYVGLRLKLQVIPGANAYYKTGDYYLPVFEGGRPYVIALITKGTRIKFVSGKIQTISRDLKVPMIVSETAERWNKLRLEGDIKGRMSDYGLFRIEVPTVKLLDYLGFNPEEGLEWNLSEYLNGT